MFYSAESIGINAFAVDWSEGFGYFYLPNELISRIIRRVERIKVRVLVVHLIGL